MRAEVLEDGTVAKWCQLNRTVGVSSSRTASPWQEDSKVLVQGIVWLLSSVTVSRVLGCGVAHLSSSAALQEAMPSNPLSPLCHLTHLLEYTSEGMNGKTISQLAPAFVNYPIPPTMMIVRTKYYLLANRKSSSKSHLIYYYKQAVSNQNLG